MSQFFFFEECPLKEECSGAAWKRCACWGWTEAEAKQRLVEHLVRSDKHSLSKEDAAGWAEASELKTDVYEEPKKRKRAQEEGGSE